MIVAIIQARMGSTRLPGKVLMDICGHPMLWHVIKRTCQAKKLDEVVVATSDSAADDAIATFCRQEGILCFQGSEDDVLDRYYQAARRVNADVVARITADCPLIDPVVVDEVITAYLENECDYAANVIEETYPDGVDVEVFSFQSLAKAWHEARLMSEREHVTSYILDHGEFFKLRSVTQEIDRSDLRWTVDHPEDLEFVRQVYKQLYRPNQIFLSRDVVKLLEEHPEFLEINQGFARNEGYLQSLREDRIVALPSGPPT